MKQVLLHVQEKCQEKLKLEVFEVIESSHVGLYNSLHISLHIYHSFSIVTLTKESELICFHPACISQIFNYFTVISEFSVVW